MVISLTSPNETKIIVDELLFLAESICFTASYSKTAALVTN